MTTISSEPSPGQIWAVQGAPGIRHALFLRAGIWNIITCSNDEYTLSQKLDLEPVALAAVQAESMHWADQFDALAAADSMGITWISEVARYREAGLAKAQLLTR